MSSTCSWTSWSITGNSPCHRIDGICRVFYSRNCSCSDNTQSCGDSSTSLPSNYRCDRCMESKIYSKWSGWSEWSGQCLNRVRRRSRDCVVSSNSTRFDDVVESCSEGVENAMEKDIACSVVFGVGLFLVIVAIVALIVFIVFCVMRIRKEKDHHHHHEAADVVEIRTVTDGDGAVGGGGTSRISSGCQTFPVHQWEESNEFYDELDENNEQQLTNNNSNHFGGGVLKKSDNSQSISSQDDESREPAIQPTFPKHTEALPQIGSQQVNPESQVDSKPVENVENTPIAQAAVQPPHVGTSHPESNPPMNEVAQPESQSSDHVTLIVDR